MRRELLVFSEGEKTEPAYLLHWRRRYRDSVTVTVDPFHGAPLQLVQRAVEAKRAGAREERRGRGRAYDEVWCVFDVDEHPALAEAHALARRHDIHVAVSNPCVELWFVLHFEDQTAHIERVAAQARSKELLACEKALTDRALELLDGGIDRATERARRLDEKHAGDGSPEGSNPSSGLWRLVAAIQRPRDA